MKIYQLTYTFLFTFVMLGSACGSSNGKKVENNTDRTIIVQQYIPIADPFILYHDGLYYAYGTSSDSGFHVYTSKGLDVWKKHSEWILHKENSYADRWFWAPEVYYNSANKTFYLYYSADEHICVATSNSPLGPFKQSVKEPMRAEKSIDSSLFIDSDGTPYIFFVRFTGGNVIWGAKLEADLVTIKEETLVKCIEVSAPWEKVMATVAEGPSVLKKDGVYYMLYSANHYQSPDYAVGYATSSSPLGPWSKSPQNPILHKPHPDLVGAGHGAPFVDAGGNLKYVFHAHSNPGTVQPRKMYITDMTITSEGVKMDYNRIIFPKEVR